MAQVRPVRRTWDTRVSRKSCHTAWHSTSCQPSPQHTSQKGRKHGGGALLPSLKTRTLDQASSRAKDGTCSSSDDIVAAREHQKCKARNPTLDTPYSTCLFQLLPSKRQERELISSGNFNSISLIWATEPSSKRSKLQIYCACHDFVQSG